jgi:hypothetical protein
MATKVTFTLDDAAISCLQDAAVQLSKPKSEIVREAIHEYYDRMGRLSERERLAMLNAFDTLVPAIPPRSQQETDAEIAAIRASRRAGGRRHPV